MVVLSAVGYVLSLLLQLVLIVTSLLLPGIDIFPDSYSPTCGDPSNPLATFYLYMNSSATRVPLAPANYNLLNRNKTTCVISHGWRGNTNVPYYDGISIELQKKFGTNNVNIILVDWTKAASDILYVGALANVEPVGKCLASVLYDLDSAGYINIVQSLNMIGHSMGAHVVGTCGKTLSDKGKKPYQATALDPAGPGFDPSTITSNFYGLTKYSAKVVIILTTSLPFGEITLFGTVNYIFNPPNLLCQPGCCTLDALGKIVGDNTTSITCSHHRSYMYYISAINSACFIAKDCKVGCNPPDGSVIFNYDTLDTTSGIWNIYTTSAAPWCLAS